MRRALSFLTVSCLLAVGVIRAGDTPSIDFDKKIDSTGIVEQAKQQGKMRRARPFEPLKELKPLPPELEALRTLQSPKVKEETSSSQVQEFQKGRLPLPTLACDQMPPSADDPGGETPSLCLDVKRPKRGSKVNSIENFAPITGPYEPLPRDNEEYRQSVQLKEKLGTGGEGIEIAALRKISKGSSIPGPVRDALLTRWFALDQERTNLILASRPLDSDDEALYRFAVRINTWYDKIVARKRILDSNIADYNRLCLGRQLPRDEYEQCEAYRARGNRCVELHNASLAENDRLVGVWKSGKKCLEVRGADFRTWVLNWINQVIKPWLGDATQAIENACDRLISLSATATPPVIAPRGSSTFAAIPKYADTGEKPCPTKFMWDPFGSAIGQIRSQRDQVVTFTSSGQRGSQQFRVEAADDFSTKVAGVVVTVAGGKLCPVDRTYDREENKTHCIYRCSVPTTPLTFTGDLPCPQVFEPE